MERIHCGNWPDWLLYGWVVPSVGLLILYWATAVIAMKLYFRAEGTTFPRQWLPWVAAFFVGCGGGHAMNALAFVWPAYVAYTLWDWYTLVTSAVGVWGLWQMKVWGREQIRMLKSGLHHALTDKQVAVDEAQRKAEEAAAVNAKVRELEDELRRKFDIEFRANARKKDELDAIRDELTNLVNKNLTEETYNNLRKRLHTLRGL